MKMRSLISFGLSCAILSFSSVPGQAQKGEVEPLSSLAAKQINRTQPIRSEKSRDVNLERAILKESLEYKQYVNTTGDYGRYYYNRVDLNGDKKPEVLVYPLGVGFGCGNGGCTTLVFKLVGQDYRLVDKFNLSSPPIIVTDKKTKTWNDLIIFLNSAGGRGVSGRAGYQLLRFDGKKYVFIRKLSSNSTITGRAFFTNLESEGGIILRP